MATKGVGYAGRKTLFPALAALIKANELDPTNELALLFLADINRHHAKRWHPPLCPKRSAGETSRLRVERTLECGSARAALEIPDKTRARRLLGKELARNKDKDGIADAAEMAPGVNPAHQLIAVGHGRTADTVLVNGRVVLRGGRSTRLDERVVAMGARALAEWVAARLDRAKPSAWPIVS